MNTHGHVRRTLGWLAIFMLSAVAAPTARAAAIIVMDDRTGFVQVNDGSNVVQDTRTTNNTQDDIQTLAVARDSFPYTGTASINAVTSFEPSAPGIGGEFTGFDFEILASAQGVSRIANGTQLSHGRFVSATEFTLDVATPWNLTSSVVASSVGTGNASTLFRIHDLVNNQDVASASSTTALFDTINQPLLREGVLAPGNYLLIFQAEAGAFFNIENDGTATVQFNGSFNFVPEPTTVMLLALPAGLMLLRRRRAAA